MQSPIIWEVKNYDYNTAGQISRRLSISPLCAGLLVQRGVKTPEEARYFLHADLKDLQDPFNLTGIEPATDRIKQAIAAGEKIVIYGDYDVDGVCSIVILKQCLEMLGGTVDYYVPERFNEGYGLNMQAVEHLAGSGYSLLITVDCGITSVAEVERAVNLGMDVIISDHHTPPGQLPPTRVIINPKLGSTPELADLCGAGVVFKLCQALCPEYVLDKQSSWLELAALATVADIVPLTGENRVLVKYGLMKLPQTNNIGLKALIKESGLEGKKLLSWHIGFVLGPRLNSAGRLESAVSSIELLLTDDPVKADELAAYLSNLNQERRMIEETIYQEALLQVETEVKLEEEMVLVLGQERWHPGVIGIVASRLCEKYRRPTILINWEEDMGKGSCRSLPGLNIYQALSACSSYLIQFGGHRAAAGLSIYKDQFYSFRKAINQWVKDNIRQEEFYPRIQVDAEVEPDDITETFLQEIKQLEPFGEGNPGPRFVIRGVEVESANLIGKEREHFKARLAGMGMEIIAFNRSDLIEQPLDTCLQDILFQPEENEFRGVKRLQLKLRDMKNSYLPDDKQIVEPGIELFQALRRSNHEVRAGRPVMFIFPTYRTLVKYRLLLRSYFRTTVLRELHGNIDPHWQPTLIDELTRGRNYIYLSTMAFFKYYMRTRNLPENLKYIFYLWSNHSDEHINEYLQGRNSYSLGIIEESRIMSGKLDFTRGQRVLVYANRNTTLRLFASTRQPLSIEAGVNDRRKRITIRRTFLQAPEGILLSDGVNTGTARLTNTDVYFADIPYSIYEVQMVMDQLAAGEDREARVLFGPDDLDFNLGYLQRIYPTGQLVQKVLAFFKKLQRNQLRADINKLSLSIGDYLQTDFKPADLIPVLHIMAELGLCEFEKKGSIMAIKFIKSQNSTVNLGDSLYYLEGQVEKKEFNRWQRELNKKLLW
jgi:single-stranded-DNA-specific exonuclease